MSHPQYLPELTRYDYDITGPLMEILGGQCLQSDAEVQQLVHEWLCTQSNEFFSLGIQALIKSWDHITQCVDHAEK